MIHHVVGLWRTGAARPAGGAAVRRHGTPVVHPDRLLERSCPQIAWHSPPGRNAPNFSSSWPISGIRIRDLR